MIVDTSPFFYGPMLARSTRPIRLLMLCGLDVPTLKNVKLSLQTLEHARFPGRRASSLVLNRVTPNVGLTKEDVEASPRPLGQLRGAERPGRGPRSQQRRRGRARPSRTPSSPTQSHSSRTRSSRPARRPRRGRGSPEAALAHASPRPRREGIMNLEDQLRGDQAAQAAPASPSASRSRKWRRPRSSRTVARRPVSRPVRSTEDRRSAAGRPELGPWLFSNQESPDLAPRGDRIGRRASSTRPGRRLPRSIVQRLIEEIAADILGYGPLERFLARRHGHRGHGQRLRPGVRRARRQDRARPTRASSTTTTCGGSSTRSSPGSVGASTRRSPMVDARLPDGSRVNAIIPPLSLNGPTLTIRKFAARPVHDRRPDRLRLADAKGGELPAGVRAGQARTSSSRAAPAPARRRC